MVCVGINSLKDLLEKNNLIKFIAKPKDLSGAYEFFSSSFHKIENLPTFIQFPKMVQYFNQSLKLKFPGYKKDYYLVTFSKILTIANYQYFPTFSSTEALNTCSIFSKKMSFFQIKDLQEQEVIIANNLNGNTTVKDIPFFYEKHIWYPIFLKCFQPAFQNQLKKSNYLLQESYAYFNRSDNTLEYQWLIYVSIILSLIQPKKTKSRSINAEIGEFFEWSKPSKTVISYFYAIYIQMLLWLKLVILKPEKILSFKKSIKERNKITELHMSFYRYKISKPLYGKPLIISLHEEKKKYSSESYCSRLSREKYLLDLLGIKDIDNSEEVLSIIKKEFLLIQGCSLEEDEEIIIID